MLQTVTDLIVCFMLTMIATLFLMIWIRLGNLVRNVKAVVDHQ